MQAALLLTQLEHFGELRSHRTFRSRHFWQAGSCSPAGVRAGLSVTVLQASDVSAAVLDGICAVRVAGVVFGRWSVEVAPCSIVGPAPSHAAV
jgi:hypothetical protein